MLDVCILTHTWTHAISHSHTGHGLKKCTHEYTCTCTHTRHSQVKNEQASVRRAGRQIASRVPIVHIRLPDDSVEDTSMRGEVGHKRDESTSRRSSSSWRRAPKAVRQDQLIVEIVPTFVTPSTEIMLYWLFAAPLICASLAGLFVCCSLAPEVLAHRRRKINFELSNSKAPTEETKPAEPVPSTPGSAVGVSFLVPPWSFVALHVCRSILHVCIH